MLFKKLLLVAFTSLMAVSSANAMLVNETLSDRQLSTGGVTNFNFTGLPAATAAGMITIENAVGSTFDLSTNGNEYFDLILDGENAGCYTCTNNVSSGINMGCGGTNSVNTFTLTLTFADLLADFSVDVAALVADSVLDIVIDFGSSVHTGFGSGNTNTLDVTLNYNANEVPAPAPLAILALGLIGLGATRCKPA